MSLTRNVLAANVRIAHALMKAWPDLPDEIPNLPPDVLNRRDALTDDVYQTARKTYIPDKQDMWHSWIWPMEYISTFPECVPAHERFDICYLIERQLDRTKVGRPEWWIARISAGLDTMSE